MKKTLIILLTFILLVSFMVACAKDDATTTPTPTPVASNEPADTVTTASIVSDGDAFINGISAQGTWIVATLNDLTFGEDLVVEGTFISKEKVARKIAPYTQDADHNITASFSITAPKMTIRSENTKFQGGTFVGDIYVNANGFEVSKATIDGNIYFATKEYMDSFIQDDESTLKGKVEKVAVDAVTTASIVNNSVDLVKALSADGAWIAATLNDITITEDLVVEGEFTNRDVVARKIAPYTQDADHNITASFTITAPKLIVRSENTKFQGGIFIGDVYVEANGFEVSKATIKGNIYYAKQEYKDSAIMDELSIVTGEMIVK